MNLKQWYKMKYLFFLMCLFSSYNLHAGVSQDNKKTEALRKVAEAALKAFHGQTKNLLRIEKAELPEEIKLDHTCSGPFKLILQGLKPKTKFELYAFNLLQICGLGAPNFYGKGYIGKSGKAYFTETGKETIELSNFLLIQNNMLLAEPVFYFIISQDRTYLATYVIPRPIEWFGENGRHVWIELMDPCRRTYHIRGENFDKNEIVTFVCSDAKQFGTIIIPPINSRGEFDIAYSNDTDEPISMEFSFSSSKYPEVNVLKVDFATGFKVEL